MYKNSIIIFGIVIPLLIFAFIIGICWVLKGKVTTVYEARVQQYNAVQKSKLTANAIESQVVNQRDLFKQWSEVIEQDSFTLLNENMKLLARKLPPKEFHQPIPERMINKIGFGTVTLQNSKALKFNLKANYRTAQKALLELESRMPNLQLQDLRIDPNTTTDASMLNIQVSYTAWEK